LNLSGQVFKVRRSQTYIIDNIFKGKPFTLERLAKRLIADNKQLVTDVSNVTF